jgi:hypothetical protein
MLFLPVSLSLRAPFRCHFDPALTGKKSHLQKQVILGNAKDLFLLVDPSLRSGQCFALDSSVATLFGMTMEEYLRLTVSLLSLLITDYRLLITGLVSLFPGEDALPVVLHTDDGPVVLLRLGHERIAERTNF